MANFPTHIAIGTVVSGALATVTLAADLVAPENLVAVTLAGVLGSVLPDIDLKDSRPARAMFAGLAVFFSFAVLFSLERKYSIAEMLILWLGTLLFVRYVGKEIFFRFSYHRGIWHSLLAVVFCAFLTACDLQPVAAAATRPSPGSRPVHVGRLPHPPDPRRDLLRRRDGYAHQGVLRHRPEAGRHQALGPHRGHGGRDGAGVHADAADQDVRREHHLARALDRPAPSPAAAGPQVVPGHGVGARCPAAQPRPASSRPRPARSPPDRSCRGRHTNRPRSRPPSPRRTSSTPRASPSPQPAVRPGSGVARAEPPETCAPRCG